MRTILKYQCQYDTGLRNRKLSIYSFTEDGPVHPDWCCPRERWGLSWQAVGSWRGDKQGPPATDSQKNLVGTGAARPGPRTLLKKQVSHSLAVPQTPCPTTCPKSLLPRGEQLLKTSRKELLASLCLGSCHLHTPWTSSEDPSPQR